MTRDLGSAMWRSKNSDMNSVGDGGTGDLGFHNVRSSGFPVKRNSQNPRNLGEYMDDRDRRVDRRGKPKSHLFRGVRRSFWITTTSLFAVCIAFSVVVFLAVATLLQSSINGPWAPAEPKKVSLEKFLRESSLKFVPEKLIRKFAMQSGINLSRQAKDGLRHPRLAIVLRNMVKDPLSLKLLTIARNLHRLGYMCTVYAMKDGVTRDIWEHIGSSVFILGDENDANIDWSIFDGVLVGSIEAKEVISSLLQEPFSSIPLVWMIQEDTLGRSLPNYLDMGWEHLINEWRRAFSRPDIVAFSDFSLPMLYSVLDTGNFYVIPGTPANVWEAEGYIKTHSRNQLRRDHEFNNDNIIVVIVGSSFFYNDLALDYAIAMDSIGPILLNLMTTDSLGPLFRFVFLCGNSTSGHCETLQDTASRLGFPDRSVRPFSMDGNVNNVFLMADIVLYGSYQNEQGFPPLLVRAMSFGIPIIAPNLPIIKQYVTDGVHGLIYEANNPRTLFKAFSALISGMKLSEFSHSVASSGKLLAKDMMASECVVGYVKLLENVMQFSSDVLLPSAVSHIEPHSWEWDLFKEEYEEVFISTDEGNNSMRQSSIVRVLEQKLIEDVLTKNMSDGIEVSIEDVPTEKDWDDIRKIEISEDFERREMEEFEDRKEKPLGSWDDIYRNAKKVEKLKFEANERDEGELERIGQPFCIYEIYDGEGAWPFLHHASIYRGLSTSRMARRSSSDDVDAVSRLPLLGNIYYRDLLCEMGGMFSIANRVDSIHKTPWIGFQSWRAVGRKVSLSSEAEKVLMGTVQIQEKGDVIYYWAPMISDNTHDFWSMCDILNGGHCRDIFENAFRRMYGLPLDIEALPPMPNGGYHWSILYSWVMPTSSFLEFIMFSRMFTDSLDSLMHEISDKDTCLLGSSKLEKKQCYCRILEILVNVWAYHSGRKMVFINPSSGSLEEQHPVESRREYMWPKYFNFTLLKAMDEDLAEEADDGDHSTKRWLWPLTGEVHWQGIYEREREERYRKKMDKKRKDRERLLDRQRHGYKQKPLGR